MVIGITLGLRKENESMWINGIKMNAIFLMNALKKCGHEVTLLDTSVHIKTKDPNGKIPDDKVIWDSKEFPVHKFNKYAPKCDILILLGTTLLGDLLAWFKKSGPNKKIVRYMCGNNYVIDMERSIFREPGTKLADEITSYRTVEHGHLVDECWYVPQQGYQNHHYYRVLMDLPDDKVKPVPFVWDPMFIDEIETKYSSQGSVPVYQAKKNEDKVLCIMEPNMNVVKYNMIPTLIVEDAYNKHNIDFKHLNIISSVHLAQKKVWTSTIQQLNIFKKKGIKSAHRLAVHAILAYAADIVISHQWENPLNYAYLDAMYLQFPLLHNADMIKDAGYYYPDFDVKTGAEKLQWILENHDNNIDEYNERNERVIERYTVYNDDLLSTYNKLIDNLVQNRNVHGLSYEYNWETNIYK